MTDTHDNPFDRADDEFAGCGPDELNMAMALRVFSDTDIDPRQVRSHWWRTLFNHCHASLGTRRGRCGLRNMHPGPHMLTTGLRFTTEIVRSR